MEHNDIEQMTSTPAGADADVVCTESCAFGILSADSGKAAACAPNSAGAACPTERLSSARPMFIGRVGAGDCGDVLPRQDFTSIPPRPSPCPGKGEQDMARRTNRFDEVQRYVAGIDLAGRNGHQNRLVMRR